MYVVVYRKISTPIFKAEEHHLKFRKKSENQYKKNKIKKIKKIKLDKRNIALTQRGIKKTSLLSEDKTKICKNYNVQKTFRISWTAVQK